MVSWLFVLSILTCGVCSTDLSYLYNVDSTLTVSNSPYEVNADTVIADTATMTIENGVEIIFNGDYNIIVKGSIMSGCDSVDTFNVHDRGLHYAQYTHIHSKSYDKKGGFTFSSKFNSSFCNVLFDGLNKITSAGSTSDAIEAIFDNCEFAQSFTVTSAYNHIQQIFTDSYFHNLTSANYGYVGDIVYDNCLFQDLAAGVTSHDGSKVRIYNSDIIGNGEICIVMIGWSIIKDSTITNCGIGLSIASNNVIITGNTIKNNNISIQMINNGVDTIIQYNNFMNNNINIEIDSNYDCKYCNYNYWGINTTDEAEIASTIKDICDGYSTALLTFWPWFIEPYSPNKQNMDNLWSFDFVNCDYTPPSFQLFRDISCYNNYDSVYLEYGDIQYWFLDIEMDQKEITFQTCQSDDDVIFDIFRYNDTEFNHPLQTMYCDGGYCGDCDDVKRQHFTMPLSIGNYIIRGSCRYNSCNFGLQICGCISLSPTMFPTVSPITYSPTIPTQSPITTLQPTKPPTDIFISGDIYCNHPQKYEFKSTDTEWEIYYILYINYYSSAVNFEDCDSNCDTKLNIYHLNDISKPIQESVCDGDDCGICVNGNDQHENFTISLSSGYYYVKIEPVEVGIDCTFIVSVTGCQLPPTQNPILPPSYSPTLPSLSPTYLPTTSPIQLCPASLTLSPTAKPTAPTAPTAPTSPTLTTNEPNGSGKEETNGSYTELFIGLILGVSVCFIVIAVIYWRHKVDSKRIPHEQLQQVGMETVDEQNKQTKTSETQETYHQMDNE